RVSPTARSSYCRQSALAAIAVFSPSRRNPGLYCLTQHPSDAPFHHHLLDFRYRLGGIEPLRAGLRAVHDGVAAVEAERVFQIVEPFSGGLVARIDEPAVGLQQDCRAEIAVTVPPVARAGRGAAGTQDAFIQPIELFTILVALQPFLCGFWRNSVQPRLDRGVLGVEVGQIRHKVFDYRHVRQRINLHRTGNLVRALGACQRIGAVDVHGAGAAYALAAGTAQRQRGIDLVLDPQERVQNHRSALVHVDEVGVDARVLAIVRRPAIDAIFPKVRRAFRFWPGLALPDLGVLGESEFDHSAILNTPAPWARSWPGRCRLPRQEASFRCAPDD